MKYFTRRESFISKTKSKLKIDGKSIALTTLVERIKSWDQKNGDPTQNAESSPSSKRKKRSVSVSSNKRVKVGTGSRESSHPTSLESTPTRVNTSRRLHSPINDVSTPTKESTSALKSISPLTLAPPVAKLNTAQDAAKELLHKVFRKLDYLRYATYPSLERRLLELLLKPYNPATIAILGSMATAADTVEQVNTLDRVIELVIGIVELLPSVGNGEFAMNDMMEGPITVAEQPSTDNMVEFYDTIVQLMSNERDRCGKYQKQVNTWKQWFKDTLAKCLKLRGELSAMVQADKEQVTHYEQAINDVKPKLDVLLKELNREIEQRDVEFGSKHRKLAAANEFEKCAKLRVDYGKKLWTYEILGSIRTGFLRSHRELRGNEEELKKAKSQQQLKQQLLKLLDSTHDNVQAHSNSVSKKIQQTLEKIKRRVKSYCQRK